MHALVSVLGAFFASKGYPFKNIFVWCGQGDSSSPFIFAFYKNNLNEGLRTLDEGIEFNQHTVRCIPSLMVSLFWQRMRRFAGFTTFYV